MFKKIFCGIFLLLLLVLCGIGIKYYLDYKALAPQREDYERIASESYDTIFLSTFPIQNFDEEDYSYYRALDILRASYCIPDKEKFQEYWQKFAESGNEISTVYLGIRPDVFSADDLIELMAEDADKRYEILLAYPSLEYWKKLSEEDYPAVLSSYTDFLNTLFPLYEENEWLQENTAVYFYNSAEWLVGNPAHYETDFGVNAGIAHLISMYSDESHGFLLTWENYQDKLEDFETLVSAARTEPTEYPDLSKWDIVFFGDSVMAFEDTSSIPGALSGLTEANVYNCAMGGSSATSPADNSSMGVCDVVDILLGGDFSHIASDSLMYKNLVAYQTNHKKKNPQCFVINFGLNDYFEGYPVQSADPCDIHTYRGALCTAIDKLRAAYPDAVIVLLTPNFTNYYSNGLEPQSEEGGILTDYVVAVMEIADEKDTLLFDSYNRLGINGNNHTEYLLDGCHPNESTRYYMGQCLAKLLGAALPQ